MATYLSQDMKDLIKLFNDKSVKYLVIGGHAVSIYSEPRSTKDIDIWIEPTEANAEKVFSALVDFGAPSFACDLSALQDKNSFIFIGSPPNRIDILKSIPGVEFEICWNRHNSKLIEDIEICFISLEDLILAKKASGRHIDLADVEKLLLAKGE